MLSPGDDFPDFSLPDQNGNHVSLNDLKGKPFVLFFYPKDLTSGCTVEACEFNAALPDFGNVRVIGLSPDPQKMHQKFINKHGLEYTLLSDENKTLLTKLGLWVEKTMYGKKYMGVARSTVLVNKDGKVVQTWQGVKPEGHAAEVLAEAIRLG